MRLLEAAYKIAASIFGAPPTHLVLVSFESAGFYWTSWHRPVVWDGVTYSPRALNAEHLSENLLLRAPDGKMTVTSLDGVEQQHAADRLFRGDRVTLRFLWWDAGTFRDSGWRTTYRIDSEAVSGNAVVLRLLSSDAARGLQIPMYTTTEIGCQLDFRRGACWARPAMSEKGAFPQSELANKCDKTLDGPLGCLAHFNDVDDVTGAVFNGTKGNRLRLPLPYRAFPGSLTRWTG